LRYFFAFSGLARSPVFNVWPGAGLLHDVLLDGGVGPSFLRDALAVDDVELGLSRKAAKLVLDT